MFNKLFNRLVALSILILPTLASADSYSLVGNLYYTIEGNTACIGNRGLQSDTHPALIDKNYHGIIIIPDYVEIGNISYRVVKIGREAFKDCTGITEIRLPETVTTIFDDAFVNCISLKKINIPSSITYMANGILNGCNNLECLEVSTPIMKSTWGNGACRKSVKKIIINESVDTVEYGAFNNCSELSEIQIAEGLKKIKNNSFGECSSLKEVHFPSTLNSIGQYAFNNNTSLISIDLSNVDTVDGWAFKGCSSLEMAIIKRISSSTFQNCPKLSRIYATSSSPEEMYYGTFSSISPSAILYVPKGLKSTYQSLLGWKTLNIEEGEPPIIAPLALSGNTIDAEFAKDDNESIVYLGAGYTALHQNVHGSLSIPYSITDYHGNVYNVVGINKNAFSDCTNLDTLYIPTSILKITAAFQNCQQLKNVYVENRNPIEIFVSNNCFDGIATDAVLHVPAGTKERYEAIPAWSKFSKIVESSPISVGDITAPSGSTRDLPIILNRDEKIAGVQFKLTLPKGACIEDGVNGLVFSNTDRSQGWTIMGKKDPGADDSYLFVMFSLEGHSLVGEEGAIMNVKLKVSDEMELGEYDIEISDVCLTASGFTSVYPNESSSELVVSDIILGDANGDGKVSIFDAVQIVNYILGNNPSPFIFTSADVDGNGKITIFDAVSAVNIILNRSSSQ